ncbi:MAG TPA: CsgG/HfaB family protein [Thermodesulfobacteriota bacterium]|nr:CsgG/HfaB family protein [Thermodesulfobacteriota bacterium]
MFFKVFQVWSLVLLLLASWGCASMPPGGGGQAQQPQMAQAQPAAQPTVPARQVTHKGPKLRVGIVDFVNKSSYGAGRLGTSASDILTTELFKTGAFIMIERDRLKQVLGEQALGQTGAVSAETAAQAGKVLGLNALVTGSISQFGVSTGGADYGVYKQKVQTAKCTVDVRVVDASTGQLLFADSGKGEFERKAQEVLGLGTRAGYDETLGQEALRSAITKFMDNLVQKLQSVEWSGAVAMVSGTDVYINAGRDVGLNPGDILMVQTLGQEIVDPQTKVVLGRTRGSVKGELLVTEIDEKFTISKVRSGVGFQVGDLVRIKK